MTAWNATNGYHPKSSKFRFQVATYSSNRKRITLKPMVAVTLDVMTINIFGPDILWSATKPDATILKQLKKLYFSRDCLEAEDMFVVDRGFCDGKGQLKNRNLAVEIPHLIKEQK